MEKIKLNNQVILMRKYVKQAKVHCINKLVKQVKLLQNRKGNEDQVLKAKRKAERFLEEISLIKKMKPDSISKLALSKAKNWKDVLLMKNCPIEDRCVALLANYEPVQKEVDVFLNLNKDLASKVVILFKEWEEKSKLNKDSAQKKKPKLENLKNKTKAQNKNLQVAKKNVDEKINESNVHNNDSKKEVNSIENIQSDLATTNDSHKLKKNKKTIKQKKDTKFESVSKRDINKCKEIVLENKPEVLINNQDCETENKYQRSGQFTTKDNDIMKTTLVKNDSVMSNNELESEEVDSDSEEDDYSVMSDNELESEEVESDNQNDFVVCSPETKSLAESSENSLPSNKLAEESHSNLLKVDDNIKLKSGDNKLKAIAMLNLDDLKDLEEIPVDDNFSNEESCEENQTNEDSTDDESPNDPFFLGRDEAVSVENKLIDDPKSKMYRSVDKIFDRKEKSFDPSSFENKSQRPMKKKMNRSQLRESLRAGTINKDNFFHKNDQKFQNRNKLGFEKNNSKGRFQPYNQYKNERDFKKKSVPNQNEYKKSMNTFQRNEMKNSPTKNKYQRKEADTKPLHPSWEAKRKQKEAINTSFQGKRMVFKD